MSRRCMFISIMRTASRSRCCVAKRDVQGVLRAVIAERGVTHGQVNFVPVDDRGQERTHMRAAGSARASHAHPKD